MEGFPTRIPGSVTAGGQRLSRSRAARGEEASTRILCVPALCQKAHKGGKTPACLPRNLQEGSSSSKNLTSKDAVLFFFSLFFLLSSLGIYNHLQFLCPPLSLLLGWMARGSAIGWRAGLLNVLHGRSGQMSVWLCSSAALPPGPVAYHPTHQDL